MDNSKSKIVKLISAIVFFVLFLGFTALVKFVDVQPVGPEGSLIGFAKLNIAVNHFFGWNSFCYYMTQIFGVLAILVALGFAVVGLVQMAKRKSIFKVDREILILGCFYVIVICFYVLFEKIVINYRPVIMEEGLEASYPSTHTLLILSIFGSAFMLLNQYIKNNTLLLICKIFAAAIIILTVVGRLICGVHWFTDIIGGILLSAALLSFFAWGITKKD